MIVLQHHECLKSNWCIFEIFIKNIEIYEIIKYCLIDVINEVNYNKTLLLIIQLNVLKLIWIVLKNLNIV